MRRSLTETDLERANIPPAYWRMKLDGVLPRYRKNVYHYLRTIEDRIRFGDGILIYGNPGVGKTAISTLIVKEAIARGYKAYFTSIWDMRDHLKERTYFSDDLSVMARARSVDVLVLDDLRSSDIGNRWFGREDITSLLLYRSSGNLPTIVTTSETPVSIKENYPELVTRLSDRLATLVVRGEDRRLSNREELNRRVLGE